MDLAALDVLLDQRRHLVLARASLDARLERRAIVDDRAGVDAARGVVVRGLHDQRDSAAELAGERAVASIDRRRAAPAGRRRRAAPSPAASSGTATARAAGCPCTRRRAARTAPGRACSCSVSSWKHSTRFIDARRACSVVIASSSVSKLSRMLTIATSWPPLVERALDQLDLFLDGVPRLDLQRRIPVGASTAVATLCSYTSSSIWFQRIRMRARDMQTTLHPHVPPRARRCRCRSTISSGRRVPHG